MIRVGLVGGGSWSAVHNAVIKALPGIDVVAVCTRHEESARRAAAQFEIKEALTDYRTLVSRPDVDLVVVATPPPDHAAVSIAALHAGKAVVCEPQIAPSAAEAARMEAAATQAGTLNVVNMQARHSPALACMADMVREGAIGQPYFAHVTMFMPVFNTVDMMISHPWSGQRSAGQGALGIFVNHCLDPLFHMFGKAQRVTGQADTFHKRWHRSADETIAATAPDTVSVLLDLVGGVRANIHVCWVASNGTGTTFDVYGSEGRLQAIGTGMIELSPLQLRYARAEKHQVVADAISPDYALPLLAIPEKYTPVRELPVDSELYNVALVYRQVIDALNRGSADVHPTFEDALAAQQTLDAIEQSSHERRWIDVGEKA